jgi:hypothetical protein
MRAAALVLVLALAGCAVPSYLVRTDDVALPRAPATREHDAQPVTLAGGSFRPTPDPPRDDGRVRVRGNGRHSRAWRAGMILTLVGVPLAIGGALLGVFSVSPGFGGYSGDLTEGDGHMTAQGAAMLTLGCIIGVSGDALLLGVGPGLWIAGARQAPVELRF